MRQHLWKWLIFALPMLAAAILIELDVYPNLQRFLPWFYLAAWALMVSSQLDRIEGKLERLREDICLTVRDDFKHEIKLREIRTSDPVS